MDFFSTRELSFIIWGSLFLASILLFNKTRSSAIDVLKAFFAKPILIALVCMLVYIALILGMLYNLDLFSVSQIKDVIIWTITVAAVSLFKINSISENKNYLKDTIRKNLIALVGIEFLISYYTYSLIIELFILPIAVVVGVMIGVASTDKKYKPAENLLNGVASIGGLGILIHAIYKLSTGFDEFICSGALQSLYFPILLSILYLPFIYCLSLYLEYQSVFTFLKIFIKDKNLLGYTKNKAALTFNFRKERLRRWRTVISYFEIENRDDIDRTFKIIKDSIQAEKSAHKLPFFLEGGWNPYLAKEFLNDNNLKTSYYKPIDDIEWSSCSPYLKLGNGILPNNLSYYLDGTRTTATALKLVLNINDHASSFGSIETFLIAAKDLYQKAMGTSCPTSFEEKIREGDSFEEILENKKVSFIKDEWRNTTNGYSYKFVIENYKP